MRQPQLPLLYVQAMRKLTKAVAAATALHTVRKGYIEAMTFNSTEIGVGNESTPTVVRVGWMVPKYSV